MWTKTFGGTGSDWGNYVQQTSDGGYIIAGGTTSFGVDTDDVYLIKTNSAGGLLWSKTYGGSYIDAGTAVQQTSDGGFILAGYTDSFGDGLNDVYLIKTTSVGDTIWTKTFGYWEDDWGYSIRQTPDDGYIVAGGTTNIDNNYVDIYLIRTNVSGDTLWTKTYGGTDRDNASAVQLTSEGGYIVGGYTDSFGDGGHDGYLIKANSSGDTIWTKTFGGIADEEIYSIQETMDGGCIAAGFSYSFNSYYAVYLIKTDSLGNSGCNQNNTATIVTNSNTEVISSIAVVTSPSTVVTLPATIVGSGGTADILCLTIGIDEIKSEVDLSIYPNPSTFGLFHISLNPKAAIVKTEVYNYTGEKVLEQASRASASAIASVPEALEGTVIDLSAAANGIYFVQVTTKEGVLSGKAVVEKLISVKSEKPSAFNFPFSIFNYYPAQPSRSRLLY